MTYPNWIKSRGHIKFKQIYFKQCYQKPTKQEKPRTRWFLSQALPELQEELTQILLKLFHELEKEKILSNFPWNFYHPDTKTRQRHIQERKFQTNIPNEHRCKNTGKLHTNTRSKDSAPELSGVHPEMQGWFDIWKSVSLIQGISRLKDKNHMTISIDAKKAFK